jgi:exopolysaccharide production protein ExoZ
MFIAGILLYDSSSLYDSRWSSPWFGAIFFAIGLGSVLFVSTSTGMAVLKTAFLGLCFYCVCLSSFSTRSSWLNRALSWPPLRWWGNISYSYYLVHGLALKAGFLCLSLALPKLSIAIWQILPLGIFMLFMTIVSSLIVYLLVEYPYSLSRR